MDNLRTKFELSASFHSWYSLPSPSLTFLSDVIKHISCLGIMYAPVTLSFDLVTIIRNKN